MENLDLWTKLAENASVILIMGAIIGWLLKRLSSKEKEIQELLISKDKQIQDLNEHIRVSEKDNLTTLLNINITLDKLIEVQKNIGDKINDIQKSSQNSIEDKIEEKTENIKDVILMKFEYIIDKFKK